MKPVPVTCILWGVAAVVALGAPATGPTSREFKPELTGSTYGPKKIRDPFGWSGTITSTPTQPRLVTPSVNFPFRLEGIQYDPTSPSAIINNRVVQLNKPVTLAAGNAAIEVKAVEITAGRVVLLVGDQRVELRLSPAKNQP